MGTFSFIRGVYKGVREYGQQSAAINREVDINLRPTYGNSSTQADAERVADETRRIKKERGVTLRNSIRRNLKLSEVTE